MKSSNIAPHHAQAICQRTMKGQAHVAQSGFPAKRSPAQRSALMLFNGFTPVRSLFKPIHANEPIESVIEQLLSLKLIRPSETPPLQKKWFGPAVAALAASAQEGHQSSSSD